MAEDNSYENFQQGSQDLIDRLIAENMGWATSIARSVARSWNLDWQLDGLDGGAYEGLIFCARRFDPTLGIPFRAYARKRVHEAATEEARKSKSWQRGVGANTQADQDAREISARLFEIFPELREGLLPSGTEEGDGDSMRLSVRQLLASAGMIATACELGQDNPERVFEYKQMLQVISELDPVHQGIIWGLYYCGQSMRALAKDWNIDELTIIREHKELLHYVHSRLSDPRKIIKKLKIRPGLRPQAQLMKRKKEISPFARFLSIKMIFFSLASILSRNCWS
ncbi:MAG: hypothetical protein IT291_06020 [Deltaproteobacteria bacterium]|nr:hypothetical protein [Deltaproteobacteria bacterium]